ncbi:MAG: nitronate monooxygenase [Kurthia sp.]|nr:nitronate monooxygenase [Candidatus Kurthia equi]
MQWRTRVTELLGIEKPIIQGGLAHLGYASLAAAVSNAGGLGQVTALSLDTAEDLRSEIHKTRALTDNPFAVNFAIGRYKEKYEPFVQVAIEEGINIISITGGNPAPVLEMVKGRGIKTLVLVASVALAQKAEAKGADIVVVVGQEGGGHLGLDDIGTQVLVPRVVDSVKIPVVASGGIADGRGILSALALGADAVEIGTRFIATEECVDASDYYKQSLINHTEMDTVVIKRSLRGPARVINNDFAQEILAIEKQTPTYEALRDYISGETNKRYIYDGTEQGFGYAGQSMGLIHEVLPVQTLMDQFEKDINNARKRVSSLIK